jgi:hypothetical protein
MRVYALRPTCEVSGSCVYVSGADKVTQNSISTSMSPISVNVGQAERIQKWLYRFTLGIGDKSTNSLLADFNTTSPHGILNFIVKKINSHV